MAGASNENLEQPSEFMRRTAPAQATAARRLARDRAAVRRVHRTSLKLPDGRCACRVGMTTQRPFPSSHGFTERGICWGGPGTAPPHHPRLGLGIARQSTAGPNPVARTAPQVTLRPMPTRACYSTGAFWSAPQQ